MAVAIRNPHATALVKSHYCGPMVITAHATNADDDNIRDVDIDRPGLEAALRPVYAPLDPQPFVFGVFGNRMLSVFPVRGAPLARCGFMLCTALGDGRKVYVKCAECDAVAVPDPVPVSEGRIVTLCRRHHPKPSSFLMM